MATWASKLRPSAVDGQTIRVLPDGRIRGNAGMEPFSAGTLGGAPSVFYVDGNVVSSGNGLGWLSAFKTLTEGLAAAHAYMSTSGNRAWAQRATVYCCGDNLDEDLALGAEKSDVIGVGTSNSFTHCTLIGNHAPLTTNTWGMRWYNMRFGSDTAGSLWTLTSVSAGIKFFDCEFADQSAANQESAIIATAVGGFEVAFCRFAGPTGFMFDTAGISIAAGNALDTNIHDSYISGNIGILINASATSNGGQITIDNNVIFGTTQCIDDNSDLAIVTNNRWINLGTLAASHDINLAQAAGNVATGNNDTLDVPIKAV